MFAEQRLVVSEERHKVQANLMVANRLSDSGSSDRFKIQKLPRARKKLIARVKNTNKMNNITPM